MVMSHPGRESYVGFILQIKTCTIMYPDAKKKGKPMGAKMRRQPYCLLDWMQPYCCMPLALLLTPILPPLSTHIIFCAQNRTNTVSHAPVDIHTHYKVIFDKTT